MKADAWRECFTAAITGILCAHRATPNPGMVAKLAAEIADRALLEAHKRIKKGSAKCNG